MDIVSLKEVVLRIILATIIGGIIGYEREFKNRAAGFRTHILVCIGATLVSLIQASMGAQAINMVMENPKLAEVIKVDYARLGAQVITGVGFLGAGTIIHTKGSIRGLTTAASLWVVACLGLGIGMGYYKVVVVATVAIFITLVTLKKFQYRYIAKIQDKIIEVHYLQDRDVLQFLQHTFLQNGLSIKNIEFVDSSEEEKFHAVLCTVEIPKFIDINNLMNKLKVHDGVMDVSEYKEE